MNSRDHEILFCVWLMNEIKVEFFFIIYINFCKKSIENVF